MPFDQRIFRALSIVIGVAILVAVPYARSIQAMINIHPRWIAALCGAAALVGAAMFYFFLSRRGVKTVLLASHLVFAVGVAFAVVPYTVQAVELVHVVVYGSLAGCLFFAWPKAWSGWERFIGVLLTANFVSLFDEIFQGLTPRRFFDLRDLAFNFIGCLWGIWLVLPAHLVRWHEKSREP